MGKVYGKNYGKNSWEKFMGKIYGKKFKITKNEVYSVYPQGMKFWFCNLFSVFFCLQNIYDIPLKSHIQRRSLYNLILS